MTALKDVLEIGGIFALTFSIIALIGDWRKK